MDVIGWVGAVVYILGYYLVSTERLRAVSYRYQGMNLVGAIFLAANAYYFRAMPSTGVNVIWGGIAIVTLFRTWQRRKAHAAQKT
jgi:hypothetical protein